jgi:hypothetical protein
VHRGAFDCQALFDWDPGSAHGFVDAEEFLDALDEVHSQL